MLYFTIPASITSSIEAASQSTAKVFIGHKAQMVARLGDIIDDGASYSAKIITASNKTFPQG